MSHYIPFTSEEEFEAYKATRGDLFIGGKLCVCRRAGVWCSDDGTVNTTGVAPLWMYKRPAPIITHDGTIEEEQPAPAFDPNLYERFPHYTAASRHTGRIIRMASGEVAPKFNANTMRWNEYAPFVEPKPFKDAREGLAHLLKPGAKMVAPDGDVGELSSSGETLFFASDDHPIDGYRWAHSRPWCPVWDAQPSAEELRKDAIEEFKQKSVALAQEYGVEVWPWMTNPQPPASIVRGFDLTDCRKPETK